MKGLLAAVMMMLPFGAVLAADDLAAARDAFGRAVAVTYAIDVASVTVQPVHPGLPDNPYDALVSGPFFAVRADFPGHDPGPAGFAAADGRTVFARDTHAIGHLLRAMGLRGGAALPASAVVRRLMWIYQAAPGTRLVEGHPLIAEVSPPTVRGDGPGETLTITWYLTRPGATGTVSTYRALFRAPPEGAASLEETLLR